MWTDEDALAALHVRTVDDDAAIEAARAQQRRIEHVGAVGGRDEDDALVRLEAVHLDEQLVQRLLALVVTAAEAGAAMAADGVDLVDEDDAGRVLLALLEEIADARRADADEHLDEVGAADREERHVRFAGHRARQQRLARSRGAHQQHALGDAAAQLLELLRLAQEVDDLLQLVLRFVHAGDVLERHLLLRARRQLRLALAERERLVAAALHLAHEEHPEPDHQQDRRPGGKERGPRARGRFARGDHDVAFEQPVRQTLGTAGARTCGRSRWPWWSPVISLPVIVTAAIWPVSTAVMNSLKVSGLAAALELGGKIPDHDPDDDQGHPEHQAPQCRVQKRPPVRFSDGMNSGN